MPRHIEIRSIELEQNNDLEEPKLNITINASLRVRFPGHPGFPGVISPSGEVIEPPEPERPAVNETLPLQEVVILVTDHFNTIMDHNIIRHNFHGKKTISVELKSPLLKLVTLTFKDNRANSEKIIIKKQSFQATKWKPPQSVIDHIIELEENSSGLKEVEISGTSIASSEVMAETSYKLNNGSFIIINFKKIKIVSFKHWKWKLIIKGVRGGNNTIVIRAKDFFGNFSDLRKEFIVGPPETIVTFPPNTNDGEGRYNNINWDREAKKASITIKGKTTDPTTNIKSIQWRFKRNDNQVQDKLKDISIISSQSVKWEFEVIMLRPEHHTIEIIAKDNAGNEEKIFVYVGVRS